MRVKLTGAALVALVVLFAGTAFAQAPANEQVRFQGRLLDSSGNPITVTTSVEFNIYDAPTAGNNPWTETHSITPSANGVFTVLLGSNNAFTGVDFSQPLYVGVTVDTDLEMTPRYLLSASSVAHFAREALTLDGFNANDFARVGAGTVTFTGDVSANLFTGNGSGLTNLNASNLSNGTVPVGVLSGTYAIDISGDALTSGSFTGNLVGEVTGTQGATVVSNAVSTNTADAIVRRDTDGGFEAGPVTLNNAGGNDGLTVAGTASIAGNLTVGGPLSVTAPITTGGPVNITSGAPVIYNSGTANTGNLLPATLTGSRGWTLPDQSGTIALTSDLTGGTLSGSFDNLTVANTGSFGGQLSANNGFNASLTVTGTPTGGVTAGFTEIFSDGANSFGVLGEATYTGAAVNTGEQIIATHGIVEVQNSTAGVLAIGTGGQSTDTQLGDNIGVHAWAREGGRNTGLFAVANADYTQQLTWAATTLVGVGLQSASILGYNNGPTANDYGLYVDAANNRIVGDLTVTGTINATITGTATDSDALGGIPAGSYYTSSQTDTEISTALGAYTPTSGLGSMAFADTADYTTTSGLGALAFLATVDTAQIEDSSVTQAKLDFTLGSMAFANTADYTLTSNLGSMAFADTGDYTTTAGLGSMAFQPASGVTITGGSGAFGTLSSTGGFTSTGGLTSFAAPSATPGAPYTAHDFTADVNSSGNFTSRALRVLMTGTGGGTSEVTGAWLESHGDGDVTQGVFGQAWYTGNGSGHVAIGLDGRARTGGGVGPGNGVFSIGVSGRADDENSISNIGTHGWAMNTHASGKATGMFASVNADEATQLGYNATLAAGFRSALLALNTSGAADNYGIYVDAANNRIVGDLTVTGNINATITGTADNALNLGGIPSANYALSADVLQLVGGTMAGDIDLGTNNITNGGTITATSFVGDLTGNATNFTGTLAGDVTGTQGTTSVSMVGGVTAGDVASGAILANGSTDANTAGSIVRRDAGGDFAAGTITANLNGNATGFTGTLAGDVTGGQGATTVVNVQTGAGGSIVTAVNSQAGTINAANVGTGLSDAQVDDDLTISSAGSVADGALSDNVPRWIRVDGVQFTNAFDTGSTFVTTIGPGAVIHGVKVKPTAAFSGTTTDPITLDVVVDGTDFFIGTEDFDGVTGDTVFETGNVMGSWNDGASVNVSLRVTSPGGSAIDGTASVWLLVSTPQ